MTSLTEVAEVAITRVLNLSQSLSNPLNPSANIRFDVPVAGLVSVEVFNMLRSG